MQKIILVAMMITGLSISTNLFADNTTNQCLINNQPAKSNLLLAVNCAANCKSCWDQCTVSSDCGVGFNCSTTPCGTRCTKQ